MKIGLPCKLGEELTDGYILVGFDKGLFTATLYAKRPRDQNVSFFREDKFPPKYVLDLPIGVNQEMNKLGVDRQAKAELYGVTWDGEKVWGDFLFRNNFNAHQAHSTEIINQLLQEILPDRAA